MELLNGDDGSEKMDAKTEANVMGYLSEYIGYIRRGFANKTKALIAVIIVFILIISSMTFAIHRYIRTAFIDDITELNEYFYLEYVTAIDMYKVNPTIYNYYLSCYSTSAIISHLEHILEKYKHIYRDHTDLLRHEKSSLEDVSKFLVFNAKIISGSVEIANRTAAFESESDNFNSACDEAESRHLEAMKYLKDKNIIDNIEPEGYHSSVTFELVHYISEKFEEDNDSLSIDKRMENLNIEPSKLIYVSTEGLVELCLVNPFSTLSPAFDDRSLFLELFCSHFSPAEELLKRGDGKKCIENRLNEDKTTYSQKDFLKAMIIQIDVNN